MRFWLQLPQGGWSAKRENIRLYALLAEELAFDGVWLGDHIVIPVDYASQYPYGALHPVPPDRPFLEAYTVLSYLAGLTERIRLAVTVVVAPYRHPLLHAKIGATLDHLSDGRLEIGLGTGWLREEFDALGIDFTQRHALTDEHLDVLKLLWTGEPVAYAGTVCSFDRVQCLPRPTQRPHPPLWIGGSGPKAFERMVRTGAGWLGPDLPVDDFLGKLDAFVATATAAGNPQPRVSAKLWVESHEDRQPNVLSMGPASPTNFELLDALEAGGTTDIRIDLARLATRERPRFVIDLARALRAEGRMGVTPEAVRR